MGASMDSPLNPRAAMALWSMVGAIALATILVVALCESHPDSVKESPSIAVLERQIRQLKGQVAPAVAEDAAVPRLRKEAVVPEEEEVQLVAPTGVAPGAVAADTAMSEAAADQTLMLLWGGAAGLGIGLLSLFAIASLTSIKCLMRI